jgi:hypothetical protein
VPRGLHAGLALWALPAGPILWLDGAPAGTDDVASAASGAWRPRRWALRRLPRPATASG